MYNFSFNDRPDHQRLELHRALYSDINTDIVRIFIEFQWTYRNMQRQYDLLLEKNGLGESRFIILMFLYQAPERTLLPSVIADKLGATRATVSKLLKGMEAKGWITKNTSAIDKRALYISLSDSGYQILLDFLPKNFNIVNQLLGSLSAEDLQTLSTLLKKIENGTHRYIQEKEK
jgi:DNA-binding MarR family transcriptional regulator